MVVNRTNGRPVKTALVDEKSGEGAHLWDVRPQAGAGADDLVRSRRAKVWEQIFVTETLVDRALGRGLAMKASHFRSWAHDPIFPLSDAKMSYVNLVGSRAKTANERFFWWIAVDQQASNDS